MEFGEISIKDKLGRTIILRNARSEDSTALIKYLRITSAETPYLIREPEEITITEEGVSSCLLRFLMVSILVTALL